MKSNNRNKQNKVEYEFGGPIGAFGIIISLPLTIYALYVLCNDSGCLNLDLSNFSALIEQISSLEFWNIQAVYVVFGWIFFQALLAIVLPGTNALGVVLESGQRLKYKCNGFNAFIVTAIVLSVAQYYGIIDLIFIYDHFLAMITASHLFCFLLSVYLYVSSKIGNKLKAKGGQTGNHIYDFYIGHELNPRIGALDLKFFCELRPGLIGWVVINFAMMLKQYQVYGEVSNGMILVSVFQLLYVADALWSEVAILTTMDITTDGFGFMLVFGDLAWVPFTYSLQSRYIASNAFHQWSIYFVAFCIFMKVLGLMIFRGANSQKDQFRRDPTHPSVKHLKTLQTKRGTKLIISGWWGIARHINYFGDWVMAWSWCLPCGFHHIIPYFYVIYFAILLIHRELRDEHNCKLKYGSDWDKYCSIVKYRIIPFIY